MRDVNSLVAMVFSGLSALVIEDVVDDGGVIRVIARTREVSVPCPVCGVETAKVHGYHVRTVADVPVDRRQTFREQVPGLIERLQRGASAESYRGELSRCSRIRKVLSLGSAPVDPSHELQQ
jgi:hypothetical protein